MNWGGICFIAVMLLYCVGVLWASENEDQVRAIARRVIARFRPVEGRR